MTTTPSDSTSTSWLDRILNTGLGAFTAQQGAKSAQANDDAAKKNAAAQSSLVKIALIGGGALAAVVVVVLIFRSLK